MSKNKNKPMSKNQKVEYMHRYTGLSYKECRNRLKKAHWDFGIALFESYGITNGKLQKSMEAAGEALKNMCAAINQYVKSVADMLRGIDWNAVLLSAAEINKQLIAKEHKEEQE